MTMAEQGKGTPWLPVETPGRVSSVPVDYDGKAGIENRW